jgi:G:T-mismatch repair DNA endonuclease (very short patch repair protein)
MEKVKKIHKNTGIKRSPETLKRMSIFHLGQPSIWKGKHIPDEAKKKISKSLLGNTNGKGGKGKKISEESKEKNRQWHINNPNRVFKDTKPERCVESELIRLNINYQKQVPLCKIARVDFYLPEERIVIQVDGCYWHGCPMHFPNKGEKERVKKQDAVLTFNGFNVYHIWEHDAVDKEFNIINLIPVWRR